MPAELTPDGKSYTFITERVQTMIKNQAGADGADGATGAPGEDAPTLADYAQGYWNSATAYVRNDVVVTNPDSGYKGHAYVCLAANTNQNPDTDTVGAYWAVVAVRGDQGPQGNAGDDLTSVVSVDINWAGTWAAATDYLANDLVRFNGSPTGSRGGWVCLLDHTSSDANKPGSGSGKWALIVKDGLAGNDGAKGASGRDGVDGVDGADGQDGADGADGATGPAGPAAPAFADVVFTGSGVLPFRTPIALSVTSADIKSGEGTIDDISIVGGSSGLSAPISLAADDTLEITVTKDSGADYAIVVLELEAS